MAINYTRLLATARRLISDSGRDVTMRRLNKTSADPARPWRGATSVTTGGSFDSVTVQAVSVMPNSLIELGLTSLAHTDLVASASALYIVAPPETGEDPATYDEVVDGSSVYRITRVERLQPADTVLLYFLMASG